MDTDLEGHCNTQKKNKVPNINQPCISRTTTLYYLETINRKLAKKYI